MTRTLDHELDLACFLACALFGFRDFGEKEEKEIEKSGDLLMPSFGREGEKKVEEIMGFVGLFDNGVIETTRETRGIGCRQVMPLQIEVVS